MYLFSDTVCDGSSRMGIRRQSRAERSNSIRQYALEISIQAKFHAIHLSEAFRSAPIRVMQVPFKLVLKSDRANDDVQLMTKFQGSAKHARDKAM